MVVRVGLAGRMTVRLVGLVRQSQNGRAKSSHGKKSDSRDRLHDERIADVLRHLKESSEAYKR